MKDSLYRWQQAALQIYRENHSHGIIRAVTGSGKTRLAVAVILQSLEEHPDLRIRIVVPTLLLAAQWGRAVREYESTLGRPGYYHGESKSASGHRVTIYVINSARYTLSRHILSDMRSDHPVLLICDECHHYASGENRRIFDFQDQDAFRPELYLSLGLSATPEPASEDPVQLRALGNIIFDYNYSAALTDQTISDFIIGNTAVSFTAKELADYAEITDKLSLLYKKLLWLYPFLKDLPPEAAAHAIKKLAEEAGDDPENAAVAYRLLLLRRKLITIMAENRIRCALSLIGILEAGTRIIVFCERIEQAEVFYSCLRESHQGKCALYHSKMSKEARSASISGFRDGSVHVLVSCKALDEGIDVPDASVGIVLSSTSVQRQRIQRLGRILRRANSKTAACMYYLYVRESAEDPRYLFSESRYTCFQLRYYHPEGFFSQEVYESACVRLIKDVEGQLTKEQLLELKSCLMEGIARPDCLLPVHAIRERIGQSSDRHKRNYWIAMLRLQEHLR